MSNNTSKGGLGRGLGALIGGGAAQPRIGQGAADVMFGTNSTKPAAKPGAGAAPGAGAKPGKGKQATPNTPAAKAAHAAAAPANTVGGATYRELPIGTIIPNPKQPRQVFDEDALAELIHSIKEFGLMQPIVVREAGESYEIIMGERRWRAASKAGLKRIPAIIRHTDDEDLLRDALLENIHRVQLNPLEEAAAYQQLLEEFGVTQAELADKIGRSRPLITNMIRLLQLPVAVQHKVAAGVLSAGHARALLGLKKGGAAAQEALAARIVAEGLSVRATEEAVTLANRDDAPAARTREKAPLPEFFVHAADRLADGLDTKVTVSAGKKKGKIVVEFGDRDDFERIMGLLTGAED